MTVRIKICGITSVSDALAAAEAGADALGFMFYERSPRHVSLESAAEIIRELPPFIARVGVFVDADAETVRRTVGQCGIDTLQFHGSESPEFCGQFHLAVIKAFRVRGAETLGEAAQYRQVSWLLDSYVPGQPGGTGATFNWDLAREAVKSGRRIILAGGLTPENAAEAVRHVHPYALDVSSGVESAPGKKDSLKMRDFIRAVRSV
jgi:phosphoribosylanthranilate isomerase